MTNGKTWLKHDDKLLAKACATARSSAAPSDVRNAAATSRIFVEYVATIFHAQLANELGEFHERERTWQSIQTRLKKEHKQIAYNVSHSHDDDDEIEAEDEDEDELEHKADNEIEAAAEHEHEHEFVCTEVEDNAQAHIDETAAAQKGSSSSDEESDDEHAGGQLSCWESDVASPLPCEAQRARLLRKKKQKQNTHIKFDDDSKPLPLTAEDDEAEVDCTNAIDTLGDIETCLPPFPSLPLPSLLFAIPSLLFAVPSLLFAVPCLALPCLPTPTSTPTPTPTQIRTQT